MCRLLTGSREEVNFRISHLPSKVDFMSAHCRLRGSVLASFEKNNGENKTGPLDMPIAEISLWACRANYLLGLAVYVETS